MSKKRQKYSISNIRKVHYVVPCPSRCFCDWPHCISGKVRNFCCVLYNYKSLYEPHFGSTWCASHCKWPDHSCRPCPFLVRLAANLEQILIFGKSQHSKINGKCRSESEQTRMGDQPLAEQDPFTERYITNYSLLHVPLLIVIRMKPTFPEDFLLFTEWETDH